MADSPRADLQPLLDVMARLRSPEGCPWDRQQTHASLKRYLLEEAYELLDAIDAGDDRAFVEELGDVLLQVLLHARLAEERPEGERWSIDDVAGGLVEKMIRRNPHVFAGAKVEDVDEIVDNWEEIKRAEKGRASAMDGIALAQPALTLAAKILERAERAGVYVPLPPSPEKPESGEALGASLLVLVARARAAGLDAEAALRRAALAYADEVRAVESATGSTASGGEVG